MGTTSKHLIENQIPYHIRESKPLFAKFLQYYYEFVAESNINSIIQDIKTYNDIDNVDVEFIKSFFEEFRSLPKNLVTDERFVAKHIYDLYQTKGSEQSLKLLFKIVYGDIVNIRYPHQYILRTSDGRWVQSKFVTISFDTPVTGFVGATGTILEFENAQGSYTIQVTEIEFISSTKLRVYFNSLNTINVVAGQSMTLVDPTSTTVTGTSVQAFSRLSIIDAGSGWKRGQTIVVPGTFKDTIVRVVSTGTNGALNKIEIIEYGWEHDTNQTLVYSGPSNAVLGFLTDYVVTTRGYYESDVGLISNAEVRLQDNKFYQQYSYVIDTNIGVESFKDIIKLVHPAGTKYFSQLIKTADIDMSQYIDSYYTQSTGTKYAQDVVDTAESSVKTVGKSVSDSTPAPTDSVTSKSIISAKSEVITSTDTNAKTVTKRATDETVTPADAVANAVTKLATDAATSSDAVTSKTIVAAPTDSSTVSDALATIVSKALADQPIATDDNAKTIVPSLFDSAGTLDQDVKSITSSLVDASTVSDATIKDATASLADASTATDAIISLAVTVSATDSTTPATDTVTSFDIVQSLNDSTIVNDLVNVAGNITIILDETATITDIAAVSTHFVVDLSDSTGATDALSISQVKYNTDTVTSTDGTPVSTYVVYQSQDYFSEIYVTPETIIDIE